MKRGISTLLVASLLMFSMSSPLLAAGEESLTRGAASLLVPGLGQYINGELEDSGGKLKTGVMILIEIGGIVTTAVLGGVAGYPQIWIGIGILILNHIWSASDAYVRAPAGSEVSLKEKEVADR